MSAPTVTPQRTQQSPIKIVTAKTYYCPELTPLRFEYTAVHGTSEGEEFVLDRSGTACFCVFEGMHCPLRKLHFHSPGEHRIDGPAGELEVHLVHEIPGYPDAYPSAYLVVGVTLALIVDERSAAVGARSVKQWLPDHLSAVGTCAEPGPDPEERVRFELDPGRYLPADRAYFRYEGSLTTGDYDELVSWVVLRDRAEICGPAVKPEASRLVQPLARRFVLRSF